MFFPDCSVCRAPLCLSDLLILQLAGTPMKLSVLLTLLAATVCSVVTAYGHLASQPVSASVVTESDGS